MPRTYWGGTNLNSESYYINLLRGRGNVLQNINNFLFYNDGVGYSKILRLCRNTPNLNSKLNLDYCFRESLESDGLTGVNLGKLSLDKIVLLSTALSVQEKEKIGVFLLLKNKFENAILTKDYNNAEIILKSIYEKTGISLWLLDACSVLKTLNNVKIEITGGFKDIDVQYLNIFDIKNNLKERQSYYVKRMSDIFDDGEFSESYLSFLKYLLYVEIPSNKNQWKQIITWIWKFSVIDIYLVVVDFLQRIALNSDGIITSLCYSNLLEIDSEKNKIITELHKSKAICSVKSSDIEEMISAFDCNDYEKTIKIFSKNDFSFYHCFASYKITALAYLFANIVPEKSKGVLYAQIIELVYYIFKYDKEYTLSAINDLSAISRVLRNFDLHKGMCVFLDLIAGLDMGYQIHEQFNSFVDVQLHEYEISDNNINFIPYTYRNYKLSKKAENIFLKEADVCIVEHPQTQYYFKQAKIALETARLIEDGCISEATSLFVKSYTENELLVYLINIEKINKSIVENYELRKKLTLGQVCYTFIDLSLSELQRDCFLDLFDNYEVDTPLELIKESDEPIEVVWFFLDQVCNTSTLPHLYRIFNTTDEVTEYRNKICEYLLQQDDFQSKKRIAEEIESITKKAALSKKLVKIEKSRLTIDTELLKVNCFDEISREVDQYNNSDVMNCILKKQPDGTLTFSFYNFHKVILKKIFDIYCKEFCFGDCGLDISLSTRVRHGALSNQVLKIFDDNHLICNGHGSNDYLDRLIKEQVVDQGVLREMLKFTSNIQMILSEFIQHTLKVVYDIPIEGAIFDFRFTNEEHDKLCEYFDDITIISFEDVVSVINEFLINKTNLFLDKIRNEKLPQLQKELIDELTSLSSNIKSHMINMEMYKDIEKNIVDCKTGIQNEFSSITQWFVLSEYNQWEDFNFNELLELCKQISKGLFSSFSKANIIENSEASKYYFKGKTYRHLLDVILIVFNNAVVHSGYKDNLENLQIQCSIVEDYQHIYISFENNLATSIDMKDVDKKICNINNNYKNKNYLTANTRQEGGMGLLKIMHIIFSVLKYGNSFYVSRAENMFRVEIQLRKDILSDEENFNN